MDNRLAYDADLVSLGHEIARLRRERGWSIDVLAGQSGVGRLTVIAVENAQRAVRVTTLYSLVAALGADIGEVAATMSLGIAGSPASVDGLQPPRGAADLP